MNLGNEAIKAIAELRTSKQWLDVRQALHDQAIKATESVLGATPDAREYAAGYARALSDLYKAVEAATTGDIVRNVKVKTVAAPKILEAQE